MPDAELNYDQVMFEHPFVRGASAYIIQITGDTSGKAFGRPIIEVRDSFSATLISNLEFGKTYLWRYCAVVNSKQLKWDGPYLFTILPDPNPGKADLHLRILQNDSLENAGGIIIIDGLHCMYNRDGKIVWFFPSFNAHYKSETGTDDLRITRAGTVTTLGGQNGMEYTLNGKMLWMTPPKMKNRLIAGFGPFYNHELLRLKNGHYLIIGLDYGWKKLPAEYTLTRQINWTDPARRTPVPIGEGNKSMTLTGNYFIKIDTDGNYALMNMAEIYEYNKKDSLVWSWRARTYLKDEDIFPKGGMLDSQEVEQEPHMNGVSIDEKNQYLYVSFRNLNRIVKLEKSTGNVVYSWGEKRASGQAIDGNDFFRQQHAPYIMNDGNILVYNDGDLKDTATPSSVEIFSQPTANERSKIIWKYDCVFDSIIANGKSSRAGNAEPLPNNNLLVCMGSNPRIFEVTRGKKVVWSAIVEKDSTSQRETMAHALYRAHYTSSLYPCYFTISTDYDTLSATHPDLELKICNAGTESDNYSITVYSTGGSYKNNIHTGPVDKRQCAIFHIAPVGQPAAGEQIKISVTSDNNRDNKRITGAVYK